MRGRSLLCFILLLCGLLIRSASGQDVPVRPFAPDAHYFDFWEGTWYLVRDGVVDTASNRFVVRRGPNAASWIEEWSSQTDSGRVVTAHAHWYIYRAFTFPTDSYLSRQGWLPLGEGRMQRISQKSYDNGETWELRFVEEYARLTG